MRALLIGLAALALALPASAGSEIYKYTDANGTVRFTTRIEEVPPAQRAAAQASARARSQSAAAAPPAAAAEPAPTPTPGPASGRTFEPGALRRSMQSPDSVMVLRDRLLRGSPSAYGMDVTLPVWGVVMEEGVEGGSYTLVALADGTASIYFSNGGGVLGGKEVPAVNAAAKRWVARATEDLRCTKPSAPCARWRAPFQAAKDLAFPPTSLVRLYVLTPSGPLSYQAVKANLASKKNAGWPLFYAGHEVMTRLREASEAQGLE
jgi:hypothetical protein